jgi:hypothetical protein
VISVLFLKRREMGQLTFASWAALSKAALSAPGTLAVVASRILVMVGGLGLDRLRGQIRGGELSTQRHGETTRMSRRNQFFRVGAYSILESSAKRVLAVL